MLETLAGIDPGKTSKILAEATSRQSDIASEYVGSHNEYTEIAGEVIAEVREKLRLGSDHSSVAQGKVVRFLTNALTESVLRGRKSSEILAIAGQAGRLPNYHYKVIQSEEFLQQFKAFGVKKSTVDKAIKVPDEYEHLMSGDDYLADGAAFSLFLKKMPETKVLASHWLLVQSFRNGVEQLVQSAWWVHPSLVNLDNAKRPLDVLMAFVDVYGLDITISGRRAKFVNDARVPVDVSSGEVSLSMSVSAPLFSNCLPTFSWKKLKSGKEAVVTLAYAINTSAYSAALKKIGAI